MNGDTFVDWCFRLYVIGLCAIGVAGLAQLIAFDLYRNPLTPLVP